MTDAVGQGTEANAIKRHGGSFRNSWPIPALHRPCDVGGIRKALEDERWPEIKVQFNLDLGVEPSQQQKIDPARVTWRERDTSKVQEGFNGDENNKKETRGQPCA